jgi:hypothetical protein
MKNAIILLFIACTLHHAQAQIEFELGNTYFAQGVGEMSDLTFVGASTEFGAKLNNKGFFLGGFYSLGVFQWRMEQLPMHTNISGYGEDVRVRSRGEIQTMGLKIRYSREEFNNKRFFPFGEVGLGHASYRQHWDSKGIRTPFPTGKCPVFQHHENGRLKLDQTIFALAEIGIMFNYRPKSFIREYNGKGAFFGFSVRYERGGRVNYANPNAHPEHFYYDSGLGAASDRPFADVAVATGRTGTKKARHEHLIYKITLLRLVF